jgi:hemoglobin-like flavoprotein
MLFLQLSNSTEGKKMTSINPIASVVRRTPKGDMLIVNNSNNVWLSMGDQVMVQAFVLSNGALDIGNIATLLQQPEDVILKRIQALVDSHYVNIFPEKRKLIANIDVITEIFDRVTDKIYFAKQFYTAMLAVFPFVAPLFCKTNWERQYELLMASIGEIITSLRLCRYIKPSLHLLGSRHDYYGVEPEHYIMFNACLLIVLQHTLGVPLTTKEQDIWTSTVEIVSIEMLKGGRPEMGSSFSRVLLPNG